MLLGRRSTQILMLCCRAWGEVEFYPGETCESVTAAGYCENPTSRLFSAFQFFGHSRAKPLKNRTKPSVGTDRPE